MPFPMEDDSPPSLRRRPGPTIGTWMMVGMPVAILIFVFVAYIFLLPNQTTVGGSKQTTLCINNLGELANAALLYASQNNDQLPSGDWNRELRPLFTDADADALFSCPVQRRVDPQSSGYALNARLAGKRLHSIGDPARETLVFDSAETRKSAIATPDAIPQPGRHDNGRSNNVAYADGHVRTVKNQ
jgi:prepilin-type processing-associated H-X9-DG protein